MACSQSLTGKASTGSELIGSYQIGVLDLLASIAWFRIHYHTCVHTPTLQNWVPLHCPVSI
jgi:hypothetical protein